MGMRRGVVPLSFIICFMPCARTDRIVYELQTSQTNVALNKAVLTSAGLSPGEANDGDLNTNWRTRKCVNVRADDGSGFWWQVDFGQIVNVDKVLVTNRGDCCPGRIADFSLDVFNTDPSVDPSVTAQHCASYPGPMSSAGVTETLHCVAFVQGRFLRISQPKTNLQFCELQVFGSPTNRVEPCGTFKASPNSRFPASTINTAGPDVTSRAECAAKCGKDTSCTGYNIKYSPSVLCEMILQPITGSPSANSEFDFYQLDPCWYICE